MEKLENQIVEFKHCICGFAPNPTSFFVLPQKTKQKKQDFARFARKIDVRWLKSFKLAPCGAQTEKIF
ncbi:MAG: hypothetical protein KBG25_04875 [Paludibacteraceae bacterium]|nr:hypothetical protein [Paludibacteraceae bacterium]